MIDADDGRSQEKTGDTPVAACRFSYSRHQKWWKAPSCAKRR